MALVKCYDPQGNEKLKEPVDARECCEQLGWTMETLSPEVVKGNQEVKESMQAATVEDSKKPSKEVNPKASKSKKG